MVLAIILVLSIGLVIGLVKYYKPSRKMPKELLGVIEGVEMVFKSYYMAVAYAKNNGIELDKITQKGKF